MALSPELIEEIRKPIHHYDNDKKALVAQKIKCSQTIKGGSGGWADKGNVDMYFVNTGNGMKVVCVNEKGMCVFVFLKTF